MYGVKSFGGLFMILSDWSANYWPMITVAKMVSAVAVPIISIGQILAGILNALNVRTFLFYFRCVYVNLSKCCLTNLNIEKPLVRPFLWAVHSQRLKYKKILLVDQFGEIKRAKSSQKLSNLLKQIGSSRYLPVKNCNIYIFLLWIKGTFLTVDFGNNVQFVMVSPSLNIQNGKYSNKTHF